MSSIILAGGSGSRMGQNKCLMALNGKSLLQRTMDRVNELAGEIILVVEQGKSLLYPQLPENVKVAEDFSGGKGPLMGVYSGLKASSDNWSLVVGCDMPFLNVNLLRYMADFAPHFDIVILRINGLPEPLHAIYSSECANVIEEIMEEGKFKVNTILKRVNVKYVEEGEISLFDPEHLSLFNVNTPSDLEKAKLILSREEVQ
ncbi:MAG: molybdenum cofactor guanylyltransferase [Dehalococcoidia bacterium]